jgi:hypothetical protein
MPIDLNELQRKLKQQQNVGVGRDGRMTPNDPKNDGKENSSKDNTTLEPKRFFK